MEETSKICLLCLVLLSHACFSTRFTPEDNYLINCGSNANASVDHRLFLGDSRRPASRFLAADKSISLTNRNPPADSSPLYGTARVFTTVSSFKFPVKKFGTHIVRFHFYPFSSLNYNLSSANFSVSVDGYELLHSFSTKSDILKECILKLDKNVVELLFLPCGKSSFAFVNALEIFSVPQDLIVDDGVKLIGPDRVGEYRNLSSHVLETIHRANVGGMKLTPFNDTLWRTWVPDEDFLVLKSAAKRAVATHPPNFQNGGAIREIAPDNVYMTAQQMNRDNLTSDSWFNITWDFPVDSYSAQHFVRLHFSDIVSVSVNQLYFNVFINEHFAYKDLDLSTLTYHALASPYYTDFVADSSKLGFIRVTVGPSDLSSSLRRNAILNGVEIMKIVKFPDSQTRGGKERTWVVVVSVVGGFIFICSLLVMVLLAFKCRRKKPKPTPAETAVWIPLPAFGGSSTSETTAHASACLSLKIPFADILSATNNFDKNLVIGSGGFGMVYKGVLRDCRKVAVKRGVPGSRQGLPEFQTEITVLSKIRHHHLVSLIGYCEERSEMILVYDFMEKGSLKRHLYGNSYQPLSWKRRLEICIGAARGLHYLHTGSAQGIIHRDIKSTNILLDENYVAKVADFGLSRSGPCLDETHVSTGVKGSFGYLDPEYFRRQQLTDKSDVYSFGVVLLEVLCARPALDPLLAREQVNLAEWAVEWLKKGMIKEIIDPLLVEQLEMNSLKKYAETAEKCLADYGIDRPTMGDVLWNLEQALQLHENERRRTQHEDNSADIPVVHEAGSSNVRIEGNNDNGSLDISTSKLFSQLMNRAGR